jgi:hypothetical protein
MERRTGLVPWRRVIGSAVGVGVVMAGLVGADPSSTAQAAPIAEFVVECDRVGTAHIDPILAPGGVWHHDHVFGGNPTVTASSTAASLAAGDNSGCSNEADESSYWQPVLEGTDGGPFRIYYRAVVPEEVQPMPFGLKLVAGDPHATGSQQDIGIGYICLDSENYTATADGIAFPRACPAGSFLRTQVTMQSCWNGRDLWAAGAAHVAYPGRGGACPSSHPVRIPQATIEVSYEEGETFSGQVFEDGVTGLHADLINVWDPAEMAALTDYCLTGVRNCGDFLNTPHPLGGPQLGGVPQAAEPATAAARVPAPSPAQVVTPPVTSPARSAGVLSGPENTAARRAAVGGR